MADLTDRELLIKLSTQLDNLTDDVKELKSAFGSMQTKFVTREEFEPIKRLVYGAVGLILVAVVGALIALVVQGGGIP